MNCGISEYEDHDHCTECDYCGEHFPFAEDFKDGMCPDCFAAAEWPCRYCDTYYTSREDAYQCECKGAEVERKIDAALERYDRERKQERGE